MVLSYSATANTGSGITINFSTYDTGASYNSEYSLSINVYTNVSGSTQVANAIYGNGGSTGNPTFTSSTPTLLWSSLTNLTTGNPFPPILNTYYYVLKVATVNPPPGSGDKYPSNSNSGNNYVLPISGGGGACFVAASNLLTPTGYKSAADIKTGDLLMTADGRQVPVKAYSTEIVGTKETAPFLLPANSLGTSCPKADLRLSPWHAIQMKKGLWMKPMSAFELGAPVQQYDIGKSVTYYHFEAPNFFKDNFVCDGTVVESFGGKQLADMKGRVYKYSPTLKAYTRLTAKPTSKAIMM